MAHHAARPCVEHGGLVSVVERERFDCAGEWRGRDDAAAPRTARSAGEGGPQRRGRPLHAALHLLAQLRCVNRRVKRRSNKKRARRKANACYCAVGACRDDGLGGPLRGEHLGLALRARRGARGAARRACCVATAPRDGCVPAAQPAQRGRQAASAHEKRHLCSRARLRCARLSRDGRGCSACGIKRATHRDDSGAARVLRAVPQPPACAAAACIARGTQRRVRCVPPRRPRCGALG